MLVVPFSRRGSEISPSPKESFYSTENYWVAPVPKDLIPHLKAILEVYDQPLFRVRERELRFKDIRLSSFLKPLSSALDLPFELTPSILRKTMAYHFLQKGTHPLMANLLTGTLPLTLHAPFYYFSGKRSTVWELLMKWQRFLTGKNEVKFLPDKYQGRFGSRLYPTAKAVKDNLRAWFSAVKWSQKRRRWDLEAEVLKVFALYLLLTFSGMRIGEALRLRWDDITPDYQQKEGRYPLMIAHVKGKNNLFYLEERFVPLSPLVVQTLLFLKKFLERKKMQSQWIFSDKKGWPYRYSTLRENISRLEEYFRDRNIAGEFIGSLRFHIFRHYFLSKALEISPESFEIVEGIMGHGGGSSFYLWRYSSQFMKKFLEDSLDFLLQMEFKTLGRVFREKILAFIEG